MYTKDHSHYIISTLRNLPNLKVPQINHPNKSKICPAHPTQVPHTPIKVMHTTHPKKHKTHRSTPLHHNSPQIQKDQSLTKHPTNLNIQPQKTSKLPNNRRPPKYYSCMLPQRKETTTSNQPKHATTQVQTQCTTHQHATARKPSTKHPQSESALQIIKASGNSYPQKQAI